MENNNIYDAKKYSEFQNISFAFVVIIFLALIYYSYSSLKSQETDKTDSTVNLLLIFAFYAILFAVMYVKIFLVRDDKKLTFYYSLFFLPLILAVATYGFYLTDVKLTLWFLAFFAICNFVFDVVYVRPGGAIMLVNFIVDILFIYILGSLMKYLYYNETI